MRAIENDVPLPLGWAEKRPGHGLTADLRKLTPGQSFAIDPKLRDSCRVLANKITKKTPEATFVIRHTEAGELRAWRV